MNEKVVESPSPPIQFQVMIDFQGAERQRLEEPASEIGLEALCAMVCE